MGQQEACMDWPVLALGLAKPDLLAQSKCPQVVFLSLEWNWPLFGSERWALWLSLRKQHCSQVTLLCPFRIVSTQLPPPLTAKVLLQGDESPHQVCCSTRSWVQVPSSTDAACELCSHQSYTRPCWQVQIFGVNRVRFQDFCTRNLPFFFFGL